MDDIDNRVKVATYSILAAGVVIMKFDPVTVGSTVKSTIGDFVTDADVESEKIIQQIIQISYPKDVILSEETTDSHYLLNPENLSTLTGWVIDPIDGTNNYKKGMSYYAISVAYIEKGKPLLGVVYDPYRRELYVAVAGRGVTRNDQPISVSEKAVFDSAARVCTSNSYEGGTQANLERYSKLGHVWVDVLGSAVLIMTDIASGRLDLYHHNGLKPWDNAATFLIAQEAGAKITDLSGKPTNWLTKEVVIGNPKLVDEFIARTAKA